MVVLDGGIFVTTPSHTSDLRAEYNQKATETEKLRLLREKSGASPPAEFGPGGGGFGAAGFPGAGGFRPAAMGGGAGGFPGAAELRAEAIQRATEEEKLRLLNEKSDAAAPRAQATTFALPERAFAQSALQPLLDKMINVRPLQEAGPMPLRDALANVQDKLRLGDKLELPLLIDEAAFKAGNPKAPDIYETKILFPPLISKMSVATALRFMLSKVETNNATYVIFPDHVLITTVNAAKPESKLKQKVSAIFDKRPLSAALRELSEKVGATISIDHRAGPCGPVARRANAVGNLRSIYSVPAFDKEFARAPAFGAGPRAFFAFTSASDFTSATA